jgi:hypothetical protein
MALRVNKRTVALSAVAVLLVAATVYDQMVGFGGPTQPVRATREAPRAPAATATARRPAPPLLPQNAAAKLSQEIAELEHFIAAAPVVRTRYQAIAVPYAEAVATFATLHGGGEALANVARARVAALLPDGVKVDGMLVAEPAVADAGVAWLTATLNLSSGDSDAFAKALVRLGDAANGMSWKQLAVVGNPERKTLRANGQLALLMVRQAE